MTPSERRLLLLVADEQLHVLSRTIGKVAGDIGSALKMNPDGERNPKFQSLTKKQHRLKSKMSDMQAAINDVRKEL